jgi:DNA-binding winged helix-turn-helix (wHTH) protein/Tol biopolymer transport system component
MDKQSDHLYEFGSFSLDAQERLLIHDGNPIPISSKTFEALLVLIQNAGHLVTKDDLLKQLWPDTFVEEANLAKHISLLRKALGKTPNGQEYIETVPKYGYRFAAGVLERNGAPAEADGRSLDEAPPPNTGLAPTLVRGLGGIAFVYGVKRVGLNPATPQSRKLARVMIVAAMVVILGAGIGIQKWFSRSRAPNPENVQMTRLTESGTAENVAISADGRYVAYASRDGEKQSLWVRQIATRSDIQIVPPGVGKFQGLTFSPEGDRIYFVHTEQDNPFLRNLYAIPVLGGPPRKIIAEIDSPISFSPDGSQFAFELNVGRRKSVEIHVANADGSGVRVLASLENTSAPFLFQPGLNWSPDGRTIAVSSKHFSGPERWSLNVVSTTTGSVRELYSSVGELGRPIWLPRGDILLFPRTDAALHRQQLWTISYPRGDARSFTNDLTDYDLWALDITRDGKTVAAIAFTTTSNVWVVQSMVPFEGQQITSGDLPFLDIAENSDGKIVVNSGDSAMRTMNEDGSQRAVFTEIHYAHWLTPCGRFLVLTSRESGPTVLMRVNVDGTNPLKLVAGSLWGPVCSPDGKFVFYVNVDMPQKIWRLPIEGGTPVEIAIIPADSISGRLAVSPDGKFLAYVYDVYTDPSAFGYSLAVIPASGGAAIQTCRVPSWIWGPRWSPDGKSLQYLLYRDNATNLWEQPVAGGKPRQLTKFTSGQIFEFNWSLDGKRLLLTRGEITSDVVLLSNVR